jgi:shikimate 5-dehydrogenase
LVHIQKIHESLGNDIPIEYRLVKTAQDNDEILGSMATGSVVINATGLGKDSPGSPLSNAANFPKNAIIWELNYRGDLIFLDQAKAAKAAQGLQIEDGWTYFIHGWTQVIAEVFSIEIPVSGDRFEDISRIATKITGR